MQIIHIKGLFHMRTDMFIPYVHYLFKKTPSKYVAIKHLGGVSHLMERQRRAFDNGGGGKKQGNIGKMDIVTFKPSVSKSCFTF